MGTTAGAYRNLPKSPRPSAGRPEQEGEPSTRKTSDDSRPWTGWARLPARINVTAPHAHSRPLDPA